MPPLFSVVIPAYNQARFLADAINSVLRQTCQDFEILVVNDAATDDTAQVIAGFTDPRVRRIDHVENRGLPAARNSGMRAARGELIALLDADDYFHPRKLEQHARFFAMRPEIGAAYNDRFELHHSSTTIREIYRPPDEVGLKDFILGFPFSPSDMVIRRDIAAEVDFFDEEYRCGGEDLDFPLRLALNGCRFARVEGALNYRRFHAGRKKRNLRCRIGDYTRALDHAFSDARCPAEARKIQKQGYANHYTEVVCWALAQDEVDLAHEVLEEILLLDPESVTRIPGKLLNFGIRDHTVDHAALFTHMVEQLRPPFAISPGERRQLIGQGFLIKGARAAIWDDHQSVETAVQRAVELKAEIEAPFLAQVSSQLTAYQGEFGPDAGKQALDRLKTFFRRAGSPAFARAFEGKFAVDQAFTCYRRGAYRHTLEKVGQAVSSNPKYLLNRGVLSITIRSILAGARGGQQR